MKIKIIILSLLGCILLMANNCEDQNRKDAQVVQDQQSHYAKVLPIHFYDYSIPRDILIQIYDVVTQDARSTYTVIETITGQVKYQGPSIGYGIPADTSLTNPLVGDGDAYGNIVLEQPEPNGLFSSKNTDGTWVLYIDSDGSVVPIYTEQKVTTYPFIVKQNDKGEWLRADNSPSSVKIDTTKILN